MCGPSGFRSSFLCKLIVLSLIFRPSMAWRDAFPQTTPSGVVRAPEMERRDPAPQTAHAAGAAKPSRAKANATEMAMLRARVQPRAQSPSGPDDPTDPYIVAEAAALNNDPNQIFAYVRDEIAFEAYSGSLRGARGTLWAQAGNTLDKASLLVALLGAAGYTAQYEHAKITAGGTPGASKLIDGMFPPTPVLLGCTGQLAGIGTQDPGTNGTFLNDIYDYYWVQYGSGGNNTTALDPNQPGAAVGQAFATADSSFTTVPTSLRQQVTVKLNVESYSQASSLFGLGVSSTTVLTQTFDASALAGNILSVGNLVQQGGGGGLDISATTFTYTPYLLIGSGGADIGQDTVITGSSYQEMYTNFPLATTIVTGVFLEVDADNIGYAQKPYTRTIFDRVGPAGRQGNSTVSVTVPATPAPVFTDYDITTLDVLTGRQLLAAFQAQQTRLNNAIEQYQAIQPALAALPTSGALTASQRATIDQGVMLGRYMTIAENETIVMGYDGAADAVAGQMDTGYYVRVYANSPRLTIAASSFDQTSGNATFRLDVLKNDMRVVPGINQISTAPYYEEVARGMLESTLEAPVLASVTGQAALDIGTVMGALGSAQLLTVLGPPTNSQQSYNPNALDSTTLTPDAQALILEAVQNGSIVIAPTQMVTVNGMTTVGWWETDANGHTVSHFVDGGHQAIGEFLGVEITANKYNQAVAKFIGFVEGIGIAAVAFTAGILKGVANGESYQDVMKAGKSGVAGASGSNGSGQLVGFFNNLNSVLDAVGLGGIKADPNGVSLIESYGSGLEEGVKFAANLFKALLKIDPQIFPFLTAAAPPLTGVTPGTSPGVQVSVTPDTTYTYPYNGNELVVYDAAITNTGPSADTFKLTISNQASFANIYTGVPSLILLPGQTGMVNVCVVPVSNLPAPGTAGSYTLSATGQNGGATASANPAISAWALPILSMTTDPPAISVEPGGSTQVALTFGSIGNVAPGQVTLTAAADPGLTVSGLASPVAVPLKGTAVQTVSIGAAANMTSNTYNIVISAAYSAGGTAQTARFGIQLTVGPLGACTVAAAAAANSINRVSMGFTLANLANAMNAAAATPSNSLLAARVTTGMNLLTSTELNAPFLQAQAPALTAAAAAVSQATAATIASALANLDSAMCTLAATLNLASKFDGQISLTPSTQTTGPNLPVTYTINLSNSSSSLVVYDLSVAGVPGGVNVSLNASSVPLTGNSSSNGTVLTLTPGASFTQPFTFTVTATPEGAPEFAVSAAASLMVRPQAVSIDEVTVTPAYGPAGTQFVVSARVFAEVNDASTVGFWVQSFNAAGRSVSGPSQSGKINLTTTSTLQTVTLGTIDSTNFANGIYSVSLTGYVFLGSNIQGATGTGSFLVGAPLSATWSANPDVIPPGNSTVQATLTIASDGAQNPVSTLVGSTPITGIPRGIALYRNGAQQLAYVCADTYVNIVDVTTASSPSVLGTFAHGNLTTEDGKQVPGYGEVSCAIYNDNLILNYGRYEGNTTNNPIPTHFATFSLANPLAPVQVGSTVDIMRSDSLGLYVAGNAALMYQREFSYMLGTQAITGQHGDVWVADLTNAPATGTVSFDNDLYPCGTLNASNQCSNVTNVPAAAESGGQCVPAAPVAVPNDPNRGGPYQIFSGAAVTSGITYFASASSTGGNTTQPSCPVISGQLLAVDTSNPSAPVIDASVSVPQMAFMNDVAIQGNIAVAVGDSKGFTYSGYPGTLVIASFDTTNPASPVLLDAITTHLTDVPGAFIVPLGQNTFAVGGASLNSHGELVLVDATVPGSLRYIPYDALFVAEPVIAQNGYFYALTTTEISTLNQLSVFQLSKIAGPQTMVTLQIPNSGNVTLAANSFNQAPASVTRGTAFDTYTWNQPSPNTITFNLNVTGVNPGDVTTVVNGGTVNYTLPSLGSGVITLSPLTVLSQQIMSIAPETQTVTANAAASYTVTINNPANVQQTFTPAIVGIPSTWVAIPAAVVVPASGSQTFNVTVTSALNAVLTGYNFFVTASTTSGLNASVEAVLIIGSAANTGSNPVPAYVNLTASLNPGQVTVGQGGSANFNILVTNTGTYAWTPSVCCVTLPGGWGLVFNSNHGIPQILPGLDDTQTILGTVTVPSSVTPGSYTVNFGLTDTPAPAVMLSLTVNVVTPGIRASMSPASGTPQTAFALVVRNIGSAQDTYNLSIVGPLAQAAAISPSVTLAAGAQQSIPITLGAMNFTVVGSYPLEVQVVSQTNPAVQAVTSATVTLASGKSVTASIAPATAMVLSAPGAATLLFNATNTGNVNDTYTVAVTGTTGPVTATLGNSALSMSPVLIPALGSSHFPIAASLASTGSGTVTVTITSNSSNTVTAQSTATVQTPSPCDVNVDEAVDVADVQMMIGQALGADSPLNDLNGDRVVNVVDVQIDIDGALKMPCWATDPSAAVMSAQSRVRPSTRAMGAATANVTAARLPLGAVTDLGTLGGASAVAYGINNLGQVVGGSDTAQAVRHAFVWTAGHMTDLGLAGAAYGINDAGQAAGVRRDPDGETAFLYADGVASVLSGVPGGRAIAIDNAGRIVGGSLSKSSSYRAFLWEAGIAADLGTLGGTGSEARAINALGEVAGFAGIDDSPTVHAFLYRGTRLEDLGTLGGANSRAFGVNAAGQVVGSSQIAGTGVEHAFLYSGRMMDLGTLGGSDSQADGIDGSGVIVGWSRTANGEKHAFVWSAGRMIDLNSLAVLETGVSLEEATAINDVGQIVANASNGRAYLIAMPASYLRALSESSTIR